MKKTTQFRELIHGTEILQLPCCHDGLSARILEQAGFKVRDDLSALAPVDQKFAYAIPDADWEFYLVAVGEKVG